MLVFDVESSVSDKAIDYADELIFSKLTMKKCDHEYATMLWNILETIPVESLTRLRRVCGVMNTKRRLSAIMMKSVLAKLKEGANLKSAWTLLDELVGVFAKHVEPEFILTSYKNMKAMMSNDEFKDNGHFHEVFFLCLNVMSKICALIPEKKASKLSAELFSNLQQFKVPPNLIHPYVRTLVQMYEVLDSNKKDDAYKALIESCCKQLHQFIFQETSSSTVKTEDNENNVTRYLFTIGEIVLVRVT